MGRIFDRFGHLQFNNEAEVSQNFLIPLFEEFLGYPAEEILPEHMVPSFDIPQNRSRSVSSASLPPKAKPDFIITISQYERVLVCDSKGPNEDLDDHLHQLAAYCIALETNLLLITNGNELRVYDANILVFRSASVEDLDLSFSELHKLLGRSSVVKHTDIERIQSIDLSRSLNRDPKVLQDAHRRRIAVALSDFEKYLNATASSCAPLELPSPIREALKSELQRFPAEELYTFVEYVEESYGLEKPNAISYSEIVQETAGPPLLLVGESGIGKTSLLQQIVLDQTQMCRARSSDMVPVLVKLSQYSRSRSLTDMILDALISRGTTIQPDQLGPLLREGRFVVLLDAFDEVFEPAIPELERELQLLIDHYGRNKIVVTTRRFRLPKVTPIRRYELQSLSYGKVEAFAQMYLGSDSATFLKEIERTSLTKAASNTLLLTLLILLFQNQSELPNSRGQILRAVIDRVCKRGHDKPRRFSNSISWEVRVSLLERLAFLTLYKGKSYLLDNDSVESALNEAMDDLERRRLIPAGITIAQILDSLAATGFVREEAEGTVFWHRAFMEYFAAVGAASSIEHSPELLGELAKQANWEDVLPLAIFRSSDSQSLIDGLLDHNVFIAANALLECGIYEGCVYRRVIDDLCRRCDSSTRPIRQMALSLLCQMVGDYADLRFQKLLGSEFVDVQKVSLVEIARRGVPNARDIVYSRLSWNLPTSQTLFWQGPSGTAVIEALGEFDDAEAHLQIVAIWRERPDLFTNMSCRDTFLKIAKRGRVDTLVKRALLDFYLSDDRDGPSREWELADVLIGIGDTTFVPRLMSSLEQVQRGDSAIRAMRTADILASFAEPQVVEQLVEHASDRRLSSYARSWFAQALSKSKGNVSLQVFEALAQDESDEVRAHGVRGLGKFAFEDIRATLLRAVHPPPYEEAMKSGFSHAWVQTAAFEVLAQHGQIELLLEVGNRPEFSYNLSREVLFRAIANQRLRSMIPFVEAIVGGVTDERSLIGAAWVFADLGCIDRAQEIIEELKRERLPHGWVAHDIVQGVHRLPAPYALGIVDEILSMDTASQRDRSGYLVRLCIGALARIGTVEACSRLADIAWSGLGDATGLHSELALRSIEFLGPMDREDWLLRLIREHPKLPRSVLKRALDTLGVIGGPNSLPLLDGYLDESNPDDIRTTCFWSIRAIQRRAGRVWCNGEEKL